MFNASPARACGIDFGTSNSTVGWWRPDVDPLIALEGDQPTLPSVVFFNLEERRPVYGRQALDEYLEGYEGRLMRSLKSLLGSKLLKSETTVLGSAMPFKDILGLFLGTLKQRAEAAAGRPFEEVVLGRPVFFVDDDPQADREASETLAGAARKIGFGEVSFQYEPIAAAFDYESRIQREERVLIVDIGGGTSDFSLVRLSPERRAVDDRQADILATGGVHIGGTDFDRAISIDRVMPLLGRGTELRKAMGPGTSPTPNAIFNDLATWEKITFVYTPQNRRMTADMVRLAEEPAKLSRLARVLDDELAHDLAFAVERGKIAAIGGDENPRIRLDQVEPGLSVPLPAEALAECLGRHADALARGAAETALEWVRAGKGPIILEMKTYRYRGHSMSDPAKYRTREEVQKMRDERDAIEHVRDLLLTGSHASEDDLKAIDKEIKDIVNESAEFAKESPEPALSELWTDIYAEEKA